MSRSKSSALTRDEEIDVLTAEIRRRRDRCPILLSVQVLSAVVATGMAQADVDEAFAAPTKTSPDDG